MFPCHESADEQQGPLSEEAKPRRGYYCGQDLSLENADSWAFIAAGIYFSNKCGKKIEYFTLPEIPEGSYYDTDHPKSQTKDKGKEKCPVFSTFD